MFSGGNKNFIQNKREKNIILLIVYPAFVNTPYNFRLSEVGQDTVVLSGLNSQAADSLKHIKRLYDETKYLKNYLDKVILDVISQLLSAFITKS